MGELFMKRLMLVWLMILCMLSVQSIGAGETPQYHPMEPVGTVPEAYVEVVQQNLLGSVQFVEGGLFTYHGIDDGKTVFERIDTKGRTTASLNSTMFHLLQTPERCSVSRASTTSTGVAPAAFNSSQVISRVVTQ